MGVSLNRLLAKFAFDGEVTTLPDDISSGGLTVYSTLDDLPFSGNTGGDQAFITDTNRLNIWDDTKNAWFNVTLLNLAPSINSIQDSNGGTTPFTLAETGDATVITINATDSDGDPLTYSAVADSDFNGLATISQNANVFTVTPLSADSATTTSATVTFSVTDNVNIDTAVSTFTLIFEWKGVSDVDNIALTIDDSYSYLDADANKDTSTLKYGTMLVMYESGKIYTAKPYSGSNTSAIYVWDMEDAQNGTLTSLEIFGSGTNNVVNYPADFIKLDQRYFVYLDTSNIGSLRNIAVYDSTTTMAAGYVSHVTQASTGGNCLAWDPVNRVLLYADNGTQLRSYRISTDGMIDTTEWGDHDDPNNWVDDITYMEWLGENGSYSYFWAYSSDDGRYNIQKLDLSTGNISGLESISYTETSGSGGLGVGISSDFKSSVGAKAHYIPRSGATNDKNTLYFFNQSGSELGWMQLDKITSGVDTGGYSISDNYGAVQTTNVNDLKDGIIWHHTDGKPYILLLLQDYIEVWDISASNGYPSYKGAASLSNIIGDALRIIGVPFSNKFIVTDQRGVQLYSA